MANSERGASLTLVASGADEQLEAERKRCGALTALYERLNNGRERALRPGMLVQWKPGLKNRRHPEYGRPVIALELLVPPLIDTTFESGSSYFREPLGIVVGLLDEGVGLSAMYVDARRFEPYTGSGIDRSRAGSDIERDLQPRGGRA